MKFSSWYSIIVGVLMIGQWGFFLAAGQVPELRTEPLRIAFHLAGEFLTAFALLVSGIALLRHLPWGKAVNLTALGMLIYSVIVSPGYFAQQGQWVMVIMFGVLLLLALISVSRLMQQKEQASRR